MREATEAAFLTAKKLGVKQIAFPGMGTGVGGEKPGDAARVMLSVAKEFINDFERIVFVDVNDEMVNAWKKELNQL
ncbi:MAG TPA: hypothetical protein EYP23_02320 [Thermoplasmata archaeon]|nr:hypothetical protein [Thermoplasmata archaeon]